MTFRYGCVNIARRGFYSDFILWNVCFVMSLPYYFFVIFLTLYVFVSVLTRNQM